MSILIITQFSLLLQLVLFMELLPDNLNKNLWEQITNAVFSALPVTKPLTALFKKH